MKITTPEEKDDRYSEVLAIVLALFTEQYVWATSILDKEVIRRWEKKHGKIKDTKLPTGRAKFSNLIDWAKANLTKREHTHTFTMAGHEFRVWIDKHGSVGPLDATPKEQFLRQKGAMPVMTVGYFERCLRHIDQALLSVAD